MPNPAIEVKRPLDPKDQFTIAELQAKTARTVGTHTNSPLRLMNLSSLGVHMLPRLRVARELARMSLVRPIDIGQIATELAQQAPPSTHKKLLNVRVVGTSTFGDATMRMVGLELDDATLDQEAIILNSTLDKAAGVSPPVDRHRYLDIAMVGSEYTNEVRSILNDWIIQTQPNISLNPMLFKVHTASPAVTS